VSRLLKIFVGLAVSLGAMGAAVVSGLVYYTDFEPAFISYSVVPFPVIGGPVRVGEPVPLKVARCNKTQKFVLYVVSPTLVAEDGMTPNVLLPSHTRQIFPGCDNVVSKLHIIPVETKPGRYHIDGIAKVLGTINNHTVPWSTESFEVKP